VVDGVVASVYVDFLGSEAAAHRSAAKYRLLARMAPRLVRWLHARGLNQPLLLFMARTLPKVCWTAICLLSSSNHTLPWRRPCLICWHPHIALECCARGCNWMAHLNV